MSTADLEFTGIASLVVETNKGVIEFEVRDLDTVRALVRVLVQGREPAPVSTMHPNASRSLKRRLKAVGGG